MDEKIAIKISSVSKDFVLPHEKKTSVKSVFTGLFRNQGKPSRQQALKSIDFEIKKGEFFGIVGRNGSGKSTLLKIIAGIYQPTRGKVHVSGKLVPFIELGVGFNPELTGRENVYLNGAILGFSASEVAAMYGDIVDFAELNEFMDQKLKNYSSGMQVRLAFSMAIRADADILLVDEVLAVGDADFQRKCFDYFKRLKKNKKTVIFVSHDMKAIEEYCTRAALIDGSILEHVGDPKSVAREYSMLFTDQSAIVGSDNDKRWGSLTAIFNPKVNKIKDKIIVSHELTCNREISEPIAGIAIRNEAGQYLFGSNSVLAGKSLSPITPGRAVCIEWAIPNIFNSGTYYATLALTETNGNTIDWWDDAISFVIVSNTSTHYIVNPLVGLKVSLSDNESAPSWS